ncbi:DUF3180 domain-containing protein [Lipingzhangella sp. LS1_29]|uniref:DUF3180 domain-containing protein n=1 Tax=Lipingzhangella rawalii TaxID=2055835 RepID=A0ABU2HAQ2_9ACTN|nr:DUF3180 domain-containing protein [Lipingzhangella rawalii]MDS1271920.1 DUF3180 domain-containing protein [Lipingzhangella rawalii]
MSGHSPDGSDRRDGHLRPIGWRVPVGVTVAAAVVAFLGVDQLYAQLPPIPWTAIPTLVLLASAEFLAAYQVRRRIRRVPGTEPVEPLSVARLFALARASTLFASAAVGLFAGVVLALLGRLGRMAPAVRVDVLVSTGTLVAALVLLAAGLVLEYCCRVPRGAEPDRARGPDELPGSG